MQRTGRKNKAAKYNPTFQEGFENFLQFNEDKGICEDVIVSKAKPLKTYNEEVNLAKFKPQGHSTLLEKPNSNPLTNMSSQFKANPRKKTLSQFVRSSVEDGGSKALSQPVPTKPKSKKQTCLTQGLQHQNKTFKPRSTSTVVDGSTTSVKSWIDSGGQRIDEDLEYSSNGSSNESYESYDSHTKGSIYKQEMAKRKDSGSRKPFAGNFHQQFQNFTNGLNMFPENLDRSEFNFDLENDSLNTIGFWFD